MQESVPMHKSPTPFQAFAHVSIKVGGRGKTNKKDKDQKADGKKDSLKNKNKLSHELNKSLPAQLRLDILGEECLTSLAVECCLLSLYIATKN